MADADLADNGDASEEVQVVMNPSELLQQAGRVTGIQEASNLLSEAILSERQVDNHLNAILAKRSNVERGLANLKDSLGLLGLMQKHAESIAGSTKQASASARRERWLRLSAGASGWAHPCRDARLADTLHTSRREAYKLNGADEIRLAAAACVVIRRHD